MESNVQPSFIPKKPVSQPGPKSQTHTSFFSIIATVVFITSLVLAAAVFGYKFFVQRSIDTKSANLQIELEKFEPKLVHELARLDSRIITAGDLIKKHFSTVLLLNAFGNATLKTVRFSSFTFSGDTQKTTVIAQGQAQDFTSVALQLEEYGKPENAKYFKDVTIINPNLNKDGTIDFSMTATVDPLALTYGSELATSSVTLSATAPIAASSTATTSQVKAR